MRRVVERGVSVITNVDAFHPGKHKPGGSDGKESACNVGDPGVIPGSGRSPGGGHGNPLPSSYPENSMDGGAWWATVHGVPNSQT